MGFDLDCVGCFIGEGLENEVHGDVLLESHLRLFLHGFHIGIVLVWTCGILVCFGGRLPDVYDHVLLKGLCFECFGALVVFVGGLYAELS